MERWDSDEDGSRFSEDSEGKRGAKSGGSGAGGASGDTSAGGGPSAVPLLGSCTLWSCPSSTGCGVSFATEKPSRMTVSGIIGASSRAGATSCTGASLGTLLSTNGSISSIGASRNVSGASLKSSSLASSRLSSPGEMALSTGESGRPPSRRASSGGYGGGGGRHAATTEAGIERSQATRSALKRKRHLSLRAAWYGKKSAA